MAFMGGVFLAVQAGFNTQLSGFLKQPIFAVIASSLFSVVFAIAFVFMSGKDIPNSSMVEPIPWYLWGIGGLFSVLGITFYFYTIPRLGISKMITLGLCGQLIFSLLAGKYGWLNLPVEMITTKKIIGVVALITGIILINAK